MRASAHLYPSSILVLFLLELLGPRFVAARGRYHTDDSIEVKYYRNPGKFVDKMASLQGLGHVQNIRLPGRPIHNFPLGIQLSRGQRGVL
jgi:hypothetical protein